MKIIPNVFSQSIVRINEVLTDRRLYSSIVCFEFAHKERAASNQENNIKTKKKSQFPIFGIGAIIIILGLVGIIINKKNKNYFFIFLYLLTF